MRPHGLQHARPPCPSLSPLSLLKLMSIESVMPSNHLILRRPLLLLPSIFPSIRVFSNKSSLHIRASLIAHVGKESSCHAGDPGSIPGSGRFSGEVIVTHSRILGLPCGSAGKVAMRETMDCIVRGLAKSRPPLSLLFTLLHSSHQVAKVLELQHQTFQ